MQVEVIRREKYFGVKSVFEGTDTPHIEQYPHSKSNTLTQ